MRWKSLKTNIDLAIDRSIRKFSQNRDFSFNFDNTVFWKQYNIIYARIGKENIPIGQYESDERATEVFKEIHRLIGEINLYYMPEE